MNSDDGGLWDRAKHAYNAKKQKDAERKKQRFHKEQQRLEKLQNSRRGELAKRAAKEWFKVVREPVAEITITGEAYHIPQGSVEDRYPPQDEYNTVVLEWELLGHHFKGYYRQHKMKKDWWWREEGFIVQIEINGPNGRKKWTDANTLVELGKAREEERKI